MKRVVLGLGLLGSFVWATGLQAQTQDAAGIEFFEKKIRPVLVAKCYSCHSASAKSIKAGLVLDSRDGILKGGDSGAAVVPGNSEDSLLIEAIRYEGLEMPPKEQLPEGVIADFVKWVKMGAPDPRVAKAAPPKKEFNLEEARQFWAFQAPKKAAEPAVQDAAWSKTSVDRFLLAAMESKGLRPVADADRHTLIRRATFDLTGLPPTPEESAAFVNDKSPDAFAKVVDRLLASPQFGERWGRHWLDVVRYAESTGKERNYPYFYAWRYRDYVIDAFNADKPYDRFIAEQVAGDLLPADSPEQRNQQLVATGFLTLGPKSLNERNREQYLMDVVDEQIDVTCRAILATTVACARCHDHKFDPLPTTDYYAMAGIFRSTEVLAGVGNGRNGQNGGSLHPLVTADGKVAEPVEQPAAAPDAKALKRLEKELADLRAKAQELNQAQKKNAKKNEKTAAGMTPELVELRKRIRELQQQIAAAGSAPAAAPAVSGGDFAMAVRDAASPADCRVNIRGEVTDLGPPVPRGFVSVLKTESSPTIDPSHSGRLELANWLTSKDNPLTARVMVNRIWHHLFGVGLVETVDNFGALGERPSHPELLDFLSIDLMEHGWSVKQSIRRIMLSRAYQLSSEHDANNYAIDPSNRLIWRMSRRRLDAEAIRDASLAVSGQLDLARPQGSPVMKLAAGEIGRGLNVNVLHQASNQRSVYLPILRGVVPEMLSVFDLADPNNVVGQRDVTTVATQALFMMNSPFVMEQSEHAARRLLSQEGLSDADRVGLAYQLALGRPASDSERHLAERFLQDFASAATSKRGNEPDMVVGWTCFCQALLASAEFRYLY